MNTSWGPRYSWRPCETSNIWCENSPRSKQANPQGWRTGLWVLRLILVKVLVRHWYKFLSRNFRPGSSLCYPEQSAHATFNPHYLVVTTSLTDQSTHVFQITNPFTTQSLFYSLSPACCFVKCYLLLRGKYWSEEEVKWLRSGKGIKALSSKFWGNIIEYQPEFLESQTWGTKNKTRRANWKTCGVVCILLTSRVTAAKNTEMYFLEERQKSETVIRVPLLVAPAES